MTGARVILNAVKDPGILREDPQNDSCARVILNAVKDPGILREDPQNDRCTCHPEHSEGSGDSSADLRMTGVDIRLAEQSA